MSDDDLDLLIADLKDKTGVVVDRDAMRFMAQFLPADYVECLKTGIPTECVGCGAPLHPHNLTRLCAECKLVARNQRLTGQPVGISEPITEAQALANVAEALGAHPIGST